MASILEGSLARTIASAASFIFLNATLTRSTPGVSPDPADPVPPTETTYSCKAIEDTFSTGLLEKGLVNATDVKILILANTLSGGTIVPQSLDKITIRGVTYTIVPPGTSGLGAVMGDPAKATWSCRCQR